MAQGTLIVEVTRYNELSPIPNAQVIITSDESGATMQLSTDINGLTRAVSLPAPPRLESLSPDISEHPFFSYTVVIRATGYLTFRIEGVQIFEDIESTIPIHMIPAIPGPDEMAVAVSAVARSISALPENATTDEIIIEIPPTAVMGEETRQQEGPVDPETIQRTIERMQTSQTSQQSQSRPSFAQSALQAATREPTADVQPPSMASNEPMNDTALPVMAQPIDTGLLHTVYIPEGVIVHLGPPDSSARNIYVPFIDYIKNVASSEIFPTWPENALRANIHAQVGFVLNRVFTEWYPSRGYNFNITNTTAYDQCFIEGRNIFENISELVDEIFNIYPRRIGRRNPLFSAYCNGTTSQCAGLSQWGTVTLANSGYTPLQTLQYYYGADVELAVTTEISRIQGSYPGFVLSLESRNEYVRTMQRQLLRIQRNYPYIPLISSATGYFDQETQAAVRAFQEIFDLPVDGRVGPETWYAIQRIYTAVARLGEIESEGIPLPGAVTPFPGRVLMMGMQGEDVRLLQQYLNDLSSVYGALLRVEIDGYFGAGTKAAVVAFQRFFDLDIDGMVGQAAWNMLMIIWNNSF